MLEATRALRALRVSSLPAREWESRLRSAVQRSCELRRVVGLLTERQERAGGGHLHGLVAGEMLEVRPAATAVEPASLASEAEPPSDADEDRSSDADEDRPSDAAAPPPATSEPPSVAAAPPSDTIEPPSVAAAATPRPLAPAEDHDEAKATSSSSIERDESKADEKKEEEDTTRGGGATETTRGGAASRTPRGGGATETTRGGAATETPRGTESPRGGAVSEPMRAETDTTRGGVVTETRGAAESKEEEPRRASVGDAQVAALLGRLGLAALAQRFADELIDAATLRLLTVEDLECMRIPPAAAQAVVREVAAAGSKKLVIDEVLDNAEEHQAKIQSELDEHRAELARLKHVLARSIPETLVCPISRDAGVLITGRGDAAAPTWIFRGDESRRRRGSDVNIPRSRSQRRPGYDVDISRVHAILRCEIMKEPVVAADGHTYERVCIEQWLASGKTTSPMTGEVLEHVMLTRNHNTKSTIVAFLDEARELGRAVEADSE